MFNLKLKPWVCSWGTYCLVEWESFSLEQSGVRIFIEPGQQSGTAYSLSLSHTLSQKYLNSFVKFLLLSCLMAPNMPSSASVYVTLFVWRGCECEWNCIRRNHCCKWLLIKADFLITGLSHWLFLIAPAIPS